MEISVIKDIITDALIATKAGVDEGVVVGGEYALLYAVRALDSLKEDNFD